MEELETNARDFADLVITKNGWDYRLDSFLPGLYRGYYSETTMTGYLTFDGVLTDVFFRIEIDSQTGKVTSFYRTDAYSDLVYPKEGFDISALAPIGEAEKTLLDAYDMEAVYSIIKADEMAKLVYVLKNRNIIAVDARTDELISFDDLGYAASSAEDDVAEAEMAMDEGSGASRKVQLSETEKTGIALYEGVKTENELDMLIKEIPEFGIDGEYKLLSANYFLRDKSPMVYLEYRKANGDDEYTSKNFTLDALTGRVVNLYTYGNMDYPLHAAANADASGYEPKAMAFLEKYYGEYPDELAGPTSSVMESSDGETASASFTYCRAYNGFQFKANSISVTLDKNGYVTGFSLNWNDGQEFFEVAPDKIITLEEARSAYLGENSVQLMYRTIPTREEAVTSKRTLALCYCFTENGLPYAVDAETGEGYTYASSGRQVYEYVSIGNMLYADEVTLLGKYGIGLPGNGFTRDDTLSGRQLMRLVLQAAGYENDVPLDDNQLESSFKDLSGIALECDDIITRGTLIRIMTILAGYKNVAQLTGIFALDAADWDTVADEMKGYCAVNCSLGLVEMTDGRLDLASPSLTAQATHAIYTILSM